jgi:propanol-preferring alcohol dehydrogenase
VVDGELPNPKLPLILGHQIVGRVEEIGEEANSKFQIGDRVGIPWLGWTDGDCAYCRSDRENLCDNARFTGYTIDGGYADFTVADARFCFVCPIATMTSRLPLLCAANRLSFLSQNGRRAAPRHLCFGNAAHLISQIALYEGRPFRLYAAGDTATQQAVPETGRGLGRRFGRDRKNSMLRLFCVRRPARANGASRVAKGGVVVCGGIHMSDIPSFPYADL